MQGTKIIFKRQVCHGRSLQNICMGSRFWLFKKKKLLTEGDKIRGGVTALCHDEDISVFGRAQVSFGVFTHSQNVPIQLWRRWKYYLHQKFFYHKILFTDFSGTAINCKLEYSSWPTFLKFQYVSIIAPPPPPPPPPPSLATDEKTVLKPKYFRK